MLLTHKSSTGKNHYEVLSVKEDACYNDIRASYKAAVLDSHPDKLHNKTSTSKFKNELELQFLNVQKAWEVLSDPKSRAEYDRELRACKQELEFVANEIELGDMTVETFSDFQELVYQCRCGDYYSVTTSELLEFGISLGTDGQIVLDSSKETTPALIILPCGSCSLKVRLVIAVNS